LADLIVPIIGTGTLIIIKVIVAVLTKVEFNVFVTSRSLARRAREEVVMNCAFVAVGHSAPRTNLAIEVSFAPRLTAPFAITDLLAVRAKPEVADVAGIEHGRSFAEDVPRPVIGNEDVRRAAAVLTTAFALAC
jgi:hypothetical protein